MILSVSHVQGWATTVPDRTTPIQYTLKPLYALLPSGPKRNALRTVLTAYVNSAGKYPSVDNRSIFQGSLTQDMPPPTHVYNNGPRSGQSVNVPFSQSGGTPSTPVTSPSPIGPTTIPNRRPDGPGHQYPEQPIATLQTSPTFAPPSPLTATAATPMPPPPPTLFTPQTTLSPFGPVAIQNRLPGGPGGQYPVPPPQPNLPSGFI